jgi:hypothetical protein
MPLVTMNEPDSAMTTQLVARALLRIAFWLSFLLFALPTASAQSL